MKNQIAALILILILCAACKPEPACISHPDAFIASKLAWPQGLVPLCWEDPADSAPADRAVVLATWRQQISGNAAVHFDDRGACPRGSFPGLRLTVADVQPHAERLGTEEKDVPAGLVLNFTFAKWGHDCTLNASIRTACLSSIALHEMLHALGFAHEQNRGDAPATCTAPPQGPNGDEMVGRFDDDSVMNYCNPHWNNNGVLSVGDIAGLRALYGMPDAPRHAPAAGACHV